MEADWSRLGPAIFTATEFSSIRGGTYVGHSDYTAFDSAANPFVLLAGRSTLTAAGTVAIVPEPSTTLLSILGIAMLGFFR